MADTFKLTVLVPAGKALEADVESVTAPTELGEVGILPDHAKISALLGSGVMSVRGNSTEQRFVVSGGFLNFSDNSLEILADSLDTVESVDRANYSNKRPELEQIVSSKSTFDPDYINAKTQLNRMDAIDLLLSHASKGALN